MHARHMIISWVLQGLGRAPKCKVAHMPFAEVWRFLMVIWQAIDLCFRAQDVHAVCLHVPDRWSSLHPSQDSHSMACTFTWASSNQLAWGL